MTQTNTTNAPFVIPAHVPPELVMRYDLAHGPEVMAFPPAAMDKIRADRRVFYSSDYGGFWVFTLFDDIRKAYQDKRFLQDGVGIPPASYGAKLIPLSYDGPEHVAYRKLMTPMFAPRQMARLEPIVRGFARERLAKFGPTGKIEFASEFALALSSGLFCGVFDLPTSEFPVFHDMSFGLIYGVSNMWQEQGEDAAKALRLEKMGEIQAFIGDLVKRRRATPGDDAISILLGSEVFGRPVTDEEVINMGVTLFFAGTDSTAGMVSFAHAYLAQHQEHKQRLSCF